MNSKLAFILSIMLLFGLNATLFAQQDFNSWDKNRDGKVARHEFPGDRDYFSMFDTNRDGFISKKEYCVFFGIPYTPPRPRPRPRRINFLQKFKKEMQLLKHRNKKLTIQNANLTMAVKKLRRENFVLQEQVRKLQKKLRRVLSHTVVKPVRPIIKPIRPIIKPIKPIRPIVRPVRPIVRRPYRLSGIPGLSRPASSPAEDMLTAEESARVAAREALAMKIRGSWVAACSKNINGRNKLLVLGKLPATAMAGVEDLPSLYDMRNAMVTVPVQMSRAQIIESIARTNKGLSQDDYQELRFMFPAIVKATGKGAWGHLGQKKIRAFYGAQLDARRKLVEQLRGFMIKSSSRMENFVLKQHQVVLSIQNTLLVGVNVVDERTIGNAIAQTTIEITRPMFIYSMRKGLEEIGTKMTPAEYQNLRNMLSKQSYRFVGKAAIK